MRSRNSLGFPTAQLPKFVAFSSLSPTLKLLWKSNIDTKTNEIHTNIDNVQLYKNG